MRNATVAALIYEFLFKVYRFRADQQPDLRRLDEGGVMREGFSHEFKSRWEWSTAILEKVSLLKRLPSDQQASPIERSPYFSPVATQAECHAMDFSAFESFDNYCYAMFTLSQFIHGDRLPLEDWSPRFQDAVASRDDIFLPGGPGWVIFGEDRFQEKVMTRWEEMEVRSFQPIGDGPRDDLM